MDGTNLGLCPMVGYDISSITFRGSATIELVMHSLYYKVMYYL
jgi:hypothetical protein